MAGIKITDLPIVSEVLPTDQILVARGETTRKAFGTALVTKQDISELLTLIDRVTSESLTPVNSDETPISLYYDSATKKLSGDITGVVAQQFGGTGFQAYTYRQILIGSAQTNSLVKLTLSGGRGIDLFENDTFFSITNTEPHIPTNLSTSYTPISVGLNSSTGLSAILAPATYITAGAMTSQDKKNLDDFVNPERSAPLVFTSSLTATGPLLSASNITAINSNESVKITLPSTANQGTKFTFVRAGSGSVEFIGGANVIIKAPYNSTYTQIGSINGQAIALYDQPNQWFIVGDLISTWDRSLTGPDSVDEQQKVGIFTKGAIDTIYYQNDWNKTTTTFESMVVRVNGIARSVIDFTSDRIGKPFGYEVGPGLGGKIKTIESGPTYFGTFASGVVNVT